MIVDLHPVEYLYHSRFGADVMSHKVPVKQVYGMSLKLFRHPRLCAWTDPIC